MRILYLGVLMPHNFHEQNTVFTFLKQGYEVFVLNTSRNYFSNKITGIGKVEIFNLYESGDPYKGKAGRIRWELNNAGLIKCYRDIRIKIKRFIDKVKPDIIYCSFGSGVLNEINMITDDDITIPIIHNLLCYPAGLSLRKVHIENRLYEKAANRISLRIHPTEIMYKYMKSHINPTTGEDMIFMEYFSENYFFKKRLPLLSSSDGEPHLIFLGRTDFSDKRSIDNITSQILEFGSSGIHIHLREPSSNLPENKYIHIFPTFDSAKTFNGELSTFMTQFDGCIVSYDFSVNCCMDRFHNTLPSRFLFGLTAGIPIIMPEGKLLSCEEVIKKYNIGVLYKNVPELKEKLDDKKAISTLNDNAIKSSKDFTYESNFYRLDNAIKQLKPQI